MFTIARARANCLLFFSSASLLLPSFLTLPPLSLYLSPPPSSSGGGFLQFPLAAARGAWKKNSIFQKRSVYTRFFPVYISAGNLILFNCVSNSEGLQRVCEDITWQKFDIFSESTLQEQVLFFFSPYRFTPQPFSHSPSIHQDPPVFHFPRSPPSLGFKMKKKKF